MLNSNEPIKVAHFQKLANQSILNGALVIEMVNNSFIESNNKFGRLRKRGKFLIIVIHVISCDYVLIEKIIGSEKYISIKFR